MDIPQQYLAVIQAETESAIKKGWDATRAEWRIMALQVLCRTALTHKTFTVNDFRGEILESEIKTHDYRAMGGLVKAAEKFGWIEPTGETIPSRVGHKIPMQVWRSRLC